MNLAAPFHQSVARELNLYFGEEERCHLTGITRAPLFSESPCGWNRYRRSEPGFHFLLLHVGHSLRWNTSPYTPALKLRYKPTLKLELLRCSKLIFLFCAWSPSRCRVWLIETIEVLLIVEKVRSKERE